MKSQAGYSNLMKHVKQSVHKENWIAIVMEQHAIDSGSQTTITDWADENVSKIYSWTDTLCKFDIPFCWLNDPDYIKTSKLSSIDPRTMKKYMAKLGRQVELDYKSSIRREDGTKKPIVMLLDMWADGKGSKDLAVYLVTPIEEGLKGDYYLLCCAPLLEPTSATAEAQIKTISFYLKRVGLKWKDILLVGADNTNVNPHLANLVEKPFIGCKAHILALAVNALLLKWTKPGTTCHVERLFSMTKHIFPRFVKQ